MAVSFSCRVATCACIAALVPARFLSINQDFIHQPCFKAELTQEPLPTMVSHDTL